MKIEDIKKMARAWNQVQEATYGKSKKEAMDPVDAKELKGKHKDRKDKDINNDGDVDSSDEYLHKRRKAVSKAIKGKNAEVEVQTNEGKYVGGDRHTWPQYIGPTNSKQANAVKKHLTDKGHDFKDQASGTKLPIISA